MPPDRPRSCSSQSANSLSARLLIPYRYRLRTPDGDNVGEIEVGQPANVGEEIRVSGNRRMRIRAVVPTERIQEFSDGPHHDGGSLVVEPVE